MKHKVKMLSDSQKKSIFDAWNHGDSKRQIAKNFETSARTVGRVIDEELARVNDEGMPKRGKPKPATQHVEPKMIGSQSFITAVGRNGQVYTADSTHPNFERAFELVQKGDIDGVIEQLNTEQAVLSYSKGKVKVVGNRVTYGDLVFDSGITKRIVSEMYNGRPFEHLVRFFEKLMLNPSRDAVYQLYGFLEHNDIKIDDNGNFTAWKRVSEDYKDLATGKFDNSIGAVPEMPRNMVCEDKNKTCAPGLHVAAKSYIPHYGGGEGRIIACSVNPANVVAIPTDYDNAKMRVCRYMVMRDVTSTFFSEEHF